MLDTKNIWMQRFIQDFTNNKFHFLRLFNKNTLLADIKREEGFLGKKLKEKHYSLIIKYSGGLHGVIGALCYFLKNHPNIINIWHLKNIVFNDKMYRFWIEDILNSIPQQSLRILKEVIVNSHNFSKYRKDIYGKWLLELGFIKNNGKFRHPLMLPILANYPIVKDGSENQIRFVNNELYFRREKIKLTKREKCVFEKLYKSKGKLVTYDAIGESLWKDKPDKFSLWAISQIISRLKKKLSFYSLSPNIITSQRGEGYILH